MGIKFWIYSASDANDLCAMCVGFSFDAVNATAFPQRVQVEFWVHVIVELDNSLRYTVVSGQYNVVREGLKKKKTMATG